MPESRTYRALSPVEAAALEAFAAANGPNWKIVLTDVYWYNARVWPDGPEPRMGNVLHALRNEFGPEWLHRVYRLPTPNA